MDDKEKEKQKRIDQIRKQIHPHDDEPDPTAYMGNYNFPQMLFAFCIGFATMFVLSIKEIENFKGCPLPAYFDEPRSTPRQAHNGKLSRVGYSIFRIDCSSYNWYGYDSQIWMGALGTI